MFREKKVFNIMDHAEEVAAPFEGMNKEYEKLIREYHNDYLDKTRSDEYKRQRRAETLNAIQDLVSDRVEAARAIMEAIKYNYEAPGQAPEYDTSEKTFNLLYWKEILPIADYEELAELYESNKTDSVFMRLLQKELDRREKVDADNFNLQEHSALQDYMMSGMEFPEFDKLEKVFNHVKSIARENFNPGLEEYVKAGGSGELLPRSVKKDLERYPVQGPGAEYRPAFKLPEAS